MVASTTRSPANRFAPSASNPIAATARPTRRAARGFFVGLANPASQSNSACQARANAGPPKMASSGSNPATDREASTTRTPSNDETTTSPCRCGESVSHQSSFCWCGSVSRVAATGSSKRPAGCRSLGGGTLGAAAACCSDSLGSGGGVGVPEASRPANARATAPANSRTDEKRSPGVFDSARASTGFRADGTADKSGDSARCFSRISPVLSPSKGTRPVSSSYVRIASAYWSTSGPYRPCETSGAM